MRFFAAVALLLSIAASVLLGLATFSIPINDAFYLFRARMPGLDLKFGTFGYSVNGQDSPMKLGYVIPNLPGDLNAISGIVHTLSYVLVVLPIGFAFAVVTFFATLLGLLCSPAMNLLGLILAGIGGLVTTLAFAIIIALYYEVRNQLGNQTVLELTFGKAFYFAVIGAALLFVCAGLLCIAVCCDLIRPRRSRGGTASTSAAAPSQPYEQVAMQPTVATAPSQPHDLPQFVEYHAPTMQGTTVESSDSQPDVYMYPPRPSQRAAPMSSEPYAAPGPNTAGIGTQMARRQPVLLAETELDRPRDAGTSRAHLLSDHEDDEVYGDAYAVPSTSSRARPVDEYADSDSASVPPTAPGVTQQQADAWFLPGGRTDVAPAEPPRYINTTSGYPREKGGAR